MSPTKSPGIARQRMLHDVYGNSAQDTSEDFWLPGKPSFNEKEKRRQSIEQQRALLEEQVQEGLSRRKELNKCSTNSEDLPANVTVRADLMNRGRLKSDEPITQESHEKSVREALERKYGKHGAALRMQRMRQGGMRPISENEEDSFYNPANAMGRDRSASEANIRKQYFNPVEEVPIVELKGSSMGIRMQSEKRHGHDIESDQRQSMPLKERVSIKPKDVSFISESQLLGNHHKRGSESAEVEQSLNSESLMMYSSDPSVLFVDSKIKKQSQNSHIRRDTSSTFSFGEVALH